ncbi:MAG TPA: ATP-grasp domain-containing protein [Fimbriiglobus sp.]|jgi:hypothetical protein
MVRVFVYEHMTASSRIPAESLYREGRAMRDAIRDDLGAVPGVEVVSFPDFAPIDSFESLVRGCDAALVIAPEFDGILESLVRRVEAVGVPVLGPSAAAVRLTADKLATARVWASAGIPSPLTESVLDWAESRVPCVIKPRFGAGSTATYFCGNTETFLRHRQAVREGFSGESIACEFVPGTAVSVAFLIGPAETRPLIPALQYVSPDSHFRYDGGELPIPPTLAERAVFLGKRAVERIPGLHGFVGVDLVLGRADDGTQDRAIEINPRLTTSYVGLRTRAATNLAGVLLNICSDKLVGTIGWKPGHTRFRPDGTVDSAWEKMGPESVRF